ncbi:unnamed protein product [marine sediment metagenome]|uniref:DUF1894 domain-containing protein n=1 Tax=marine sediment metagenome TaxID=412755 RepID=X1QEC5_9ZZZZ
MGCIELMDYEILLSDISFKEGREFIRRNFKDVHEVEPGYKLFDVYLIGIPPILVGVEDAYVIFPYVKPCHGTFVLKIEDREEVERLRAKR